MSNLPSTKSEKLFLFDSSALIAAHNELYPPDVFKGVWTELSSAAQKHIIACPRAVVDEVAAKDDAVNKWVLQHKTKLILPLEDVNSGRQAERLLPELKAKYPRLPQRDADYSLLAWGKVLCCPVVTMESPKAKNKIPNIGREENVECIVLAEFMRWQGWEF